jgi:ADP-ribose pyrophosphatase YjhB (NUDIX family)
VILTINACGQLDDRPMISYCPYCGERLKSRYWEGAIRRFCLGCNQPIYENPVPAVCAVVPNVDGQILLVRRGVAPKKGGWCLPGGFMELGESPESAVLRELQEETGLSGRVEYLLGLRSTPSRLYHTVLLGAYLVTPENGIPMAGDDAIAARWFGSTEMPTIAFDSHRSFIRRYRSNHVQALQTSDGASRL